MASVKKVDVDLLKTMPLPNWNDETSKASRGKLLIIGGSRRLPGAIILAARAALRIGCGTVRAAVPASIAVQIGAAVPELMVLPVQETLQGTIAANSASKLLKEQMKACSAIVLGPGIDEDKDTEKAVQELLAKAPLPMVVDAQVRYILAKKER
jgi:NAD(P)H-hydrate repair Nnr-like enzyme with NAD(P)H-hydrate dehydratase domain